MAASPRQPETTSPLWDRAPNHVAYRASRENVSRLLEGRPEAADLPVPACPEWTVRQTVAHMVEICWSTHGRLTGGPAAPPVPVADLSLVELLGEWTTIGERVERSLADSARGGSVMAMDAFTHELDIRHVLAAPPPADHPAYPGALDVVIGGFSGSVSTLGLPALRIETPGAQWTAGTGEPITTVSSHRHDLYRSLTGRRTLRQIGELSWSGPGEAWSPAFTWGPFHPPKNPTEKATAGA
jgi:uncharacterized protein (TIGR03083 family)